LLLKHRIIANAPPISRENLSDPLRVLAPKLLCPHPAGLAHWGWPNWANPRSGHPRLLRCGRAATPGTSMGLPRGHPQGLGVAFEPTLDGSRVGPLGFFFYFVASSLLGLFFYLVLFCWNTKDDCCFLLEFNAEACFLMVHEH
jgi:hypothetical protein